MEIPFLYSVIPNYRSMIKILRFDLSITARFIIIKKKRSEHAKLSNNLRHYISGNSAEKLSYTSIKLGLVIKSIISIYNNNNNNFAHSRRKIRRVITSFNARSREQCAACKHFPRNNNIQKTQELAVLTKNSRI